ncbi:MAG: DUF5714 domain-containing protein [Candidatus Desantisbacteria bacterium]
MEEKKRQDCMVCGQGLEYLASATSVTCIYCGKEEEGYFRCHEGHYVCNECHSRDGLEIITNFCLSSKSTNPLDMANTIMKHPKIHMIGPEHHPLIAGVLVAAYKNLTGKIGDDEIKEAIKRGHTIPGGYCGLYGTDGAAIACGIAASVILKATPLSDTERIIANMLTSRALSAIANYRGSRCCKRSTWVALETAIQYFREVLKVEMGYIPASQIQCEYSQRNNHCSKADCRFYPGKGVDDVSIYA